MSTVIELIKQGDYNTASLLINCLTDNQRILLRQTLDKLALPVPRNCYFNYQTQTWIT